MPRGGTVSLQMSSRKPITGAETDVQGIVSVALDKTDLTRALVRGDSPGLARLTLIDKDGGREMFELLVQTDVEYLKYVLRRAVPTANIEPVPSANNAFVLTGTVAQPADVAIVLATAQSIIGNNIINAMRVGGVQQVQLDVIIALVDRSRARNIGYSFIENRNQYFLSSTIAGGGSITSNLMTSPTTVSAALTGTPNIISGILTSSNGFTSYLNALKTEAVAKTLAEPKIVTLDGRPAMFVSGGEQAVPTLASGSAGGGAVSGVNFVPFGTTVRFLPIIKGNGMIYLEVEPQVTFPSGNAAIASPVSGTNGSVAGRTTQRVQTSVLIEDGQTFAIGGLIQKTSSITTTKIPILGDLPVLGVAFRTTNDTEDDQELLILVTPHLVDPLSCKQLPKYLPGQETRRPDDFELFLEGILEAPRGPREVWQNHHYVPAFRNSATMVQYPCGPNGCGSGGACGGACGSGCQNGQCGVQGSILTQGQPVAPAMHRELAPATVENGTHSEGQTRSMPPIPVTGPPTVPPPLPLAPEAPGVPVTSVPGNLNSTTTTSALLNPPANGEQR